MPNRILIPLDGSDFSRQILSQVQKIFPPGNTELVLLRVLAPVVGVTGAPPRPMSVDVPTLLYESASDLEHSAHPIYASQTAENLTAEILDTLEQDAQPLRHAGYRVSAYCRLGDAAEEIGGLVESEPIDAIAMTTHGRSGMSQIIFGSVAHEVLRNVNVPVMLFRPREK